MKFIRKAKETRTHPTNAIANAFHGVPDNLKNWNAGVHAALERSTLHSHVHTERRAAVVVALRSNLRDGVVPHPCWFFVGWFALRERQRTHERQGGASRGWAMHGARAGPGE